MKRKGKWKCIGKGNREKGTGKVKGKGKGEVKGNRKEKERKIDKSELKKEGKIKEKGRGSFCTSNKIYIATHQVSFSLSDYIQISKRSLKCLQYIKSQMTSY